ncbi:MAG TPA: FAD-dependent oxidoreductase, partial [Ktedonobacteraceae bacterium]|nr:FAD-dependent oxidoreductase [Ktedonobacteraceae bacterium]
MTERCSYIIIGNGIAGITAAETLRNEDAAAEITVIGEHPMPVYTRPALKDFLAGRSSEEDLYARRRSFFADHRLHFVFDRAVSVEVDAHSVQLRSGRHMSYDRLLLATGARARRLSCPGCDLAGVVALRTLADFQSARQSLEAARSVVVVGAGPVALETVEILHHRGYQVTHLLRGRRLWPEVLDMTASNLVLQQERREGIDVRAEEEVMEIVGRQGGVVGVITRSGARIACDLVITAIGSEPVIDFIQASGIACARGVKADHAMRTAAPDIFAAGDVAEVIDPITGQPRCISQWYPAIQQGRTAAYAMLGHLVTHHLMQPSTHNNAYLRSITTAYFFGYDIAAVGITTPNALIASRTPVVSNAYQEIFADPGTHLYSKALLKDGILIGALSFDGRRDMLACKRAIDHAVSLTPVASHLFDREFKLANWLDSQKVPTPVLAVRKARIDNQRPNSVGKSTPAHGMKTQFASPPGVRVGTLVGATRLRAGGDPYTMPIVTVTMSGAPGGSPASALAMSQEIAFLAPILPLETVRALYTAMPDKGSNHPYSLSLGGDTALSRPGEEADMSSLAPEWSHTLLNPGETITIGRDSTSTLVLNHGTVSRHHAEITCDHGYYCLRDLDSKNGTFVNGARLEPYRVHVLQPRDQVRIGT